MRIYNKPAYLIGLCLFLVSALSSQTNAFTSKLIFNISSSLNDAEEQSTGTVNFTSSDIELGYDGTKKQLAALRFENISIPGDTEISAAYIQFTTDEVKTGECAVSFRGEKSSNSTAFSDSDFNLSSRLKTDAQITWSPDDWLAIDAASDGQQSPDIMLILKEIFSHPHWQNGNSISLFIEGSGTRTSYSYDKDPGKSAKLIIEVVYKASQTKVSNLYINELMPKNYALNDEYGEADDWLELWNKNVFDVFIGGLYFSDDIQDLGKWQLSTPLTIPAGGYQIIWTDDDEEQGPLHTNFKLSAKGEMVVLSQFIHDQFEILDLVSFDSIPADMSYGRNEDGAIMWSWMGKPTPGSTNNDNSLYFPEPQISLPSGYYSDSFEVSLSSFSPGAAIYYTLDGSNPDELKNRYTYPILIDSTTLLKAIAIQDGYAPSKESTAFYLLKSHHGLPVFCISTKTEYLWDDSIGIYTIGTNGTTHNNFPVPANFFQDWERPASITMIGPDGQEAFTEGAGIEIGGNASRGQIQKAFNIHFRDKYGSGKVNYKLFDDRDATKFKHIKLRNGGQDFRSTMIRDGLNHSILTNDADVDVLAYRPAVLYLNGEYWGMYGLRESFNDDYLDTYYPVKKDKLDILTGSGPGVKVDEGSDSAFKALYQFIANNDLSIQENYDFVANNIDINSYIDYHLTQIYYGNSDWPSNNVKVWRDQKGGKWRWLLFDTDASTNYEDWGNTEPGFNTLEFATDPNSTKWPNHQRSNLFMRKLFANERFRHEFAQRTCTYQKTVFNPEKTDALIDSVLFMIDQEIDDHIEKWSQAYDFGRNVTCDTTRFNWERNVNAYKQFFHDRPAHITEHYSGYFDISGSYDLYFNYDENTRGSLFVHHNTMPVPLNFSCRYFNDYTLPIEAIPDSGYHFVEWKETGDSAAQINFIASTSTILTPVFEENGQSTVLVKKQSHVYFKAFPNPAKNSDIKLVFGNLKQDLNYEFVLFSASGQTMHKYRFTANASMETQLIQTSLLSSGVYILKLTGTDEPQVLKLIVQN